MLDGAAADRLAAQVHHDERAVRRPHLMRLGRGALAWIERALGCPAVQLGHVRTQATLRIRRLRVDRADLDERRGDQPLHSAHGGHELGALARFERIENRSGELVAPLVEDRAFGEPLVG
jgi:hypothetical protein